MRRRVPELNTTSTADISFILLVFFLIMTSMDADKALTARIPPADTEQQETFDINKNEALQITLAADGTLTLDGDTIDIEKVSGRALKFIRSLATPSRHVVMITVDRDAPYEDYFNLQNALAKTYSTLRDDYARRTFSTTYKGCDPEQREECRKAYPMRVAERQRKDGKEVRE